MIILRHADSESSTRLRDYDRPISQQGKREAAKVAAQLSELGWVPDLIIASNSKRTKQTLDTMAEAASELALVRAGGVAWQGGREGGGM
jgi:phosphohistidine phosphatase SixA